MQEDDVAFLLAEHGYDLTLTRAGSGGSYDAETGTITGGAADATYSIRGVFIEYRAEQINNTTILANDRKLLIQAKGIPVAPQIGDNVGDVRIVGPVRKIQSGSTVLAYTAQVRA